MENPPSYVTTYNYSCNNSFYHTFIYRNQLDCYNDKSHENVIVKFHFKSPCAIMR